MLIRFTGTGKLDRKDRKDTFGGASRDRTDDLIVANDALSQLSYSPTRGWFDFNIATRCR